MAKRSTTQSRRDCATVNNSINTYGYAIIGDTSYATLYGKRLLSNQVTTQISLLSEGVDKTNLNDLTDISFAANNNTRMLHHLKAEQIHMIPAGDNQDENDDDIYTETERIIHYYVGAGPLGDFISAYHIPRLGPWFPHSSSGRLEKFLSDSTVKSTLNSEETVIVDRLRCIWGLPLTSSVLVKQPSILNVHYEFLQPQAHDHYSREIFFLNQYQMVNQASNADYISEVSNLRFTPTDQASGLYNISGNGFSLSAVRPIWKTNPYTYLRLATEAGLNPSPLQIPTFYRAVLSIPTNGSGATGITGVFVIPGTTGNICCASTGTNEFTGYTGMSGMSGVTYYVGLSGISGISGLSGISDLSGNSGINLTNLLSTEDLVTTHVAFSLYDINNPKNSSLAWLLQAYTTLEDLSIVQPEGRYADIGRTLLIVEGISTKNKRKASYNTAEHETQIQYNDRIVEASYLRQFAQIVARVYNAYTGRLISEDYLLNNDSVCSSTHGICQDGNTIIDYSLRESPMVSVVQLASNMYGVDIYPNPSKC